MFDSLFATLEIINTGIESTLETLPYRPLGVALFLVEVAVGTWTMAILLGVSD